MSDNLSSNEKPTALDQWWDEEAVVMRAHQALTAFVNAQGCRDRTDAMVALAALVMVANEALHLVRHGQMEKLS